MSAEHFTTILCADARTDPNDRSKAEFATYLTGEPRWTDGVPDGWAGVLLHAHDVIRIAAETVMSEPMDGLSGDHPKKRAQISLLLDHCATAVRALALDAACDGAMTDEKWEMLLAYIGEVAKE